MEDAAVLGIDPESILCDAKGDAFKAQKGSFLKRSDNVKTLTFV